MPSQWGGGFCLFSWFLRAKLLTSQSLKQREFQWMKERVKCYTHSLLCRYCRHYEATTKQDWFTLASDLNGLTWLTAAFHNVLLQIMVKNRIFGWYSISNSGPVNVQTKKINFPADSTSYFEKICYITRILFGETFWRDFTISHDLLELLWKKCSLTNDC